MLFTRRERGRPLLERSRRAAKERTGHGNSGPVYAEERNALLNPDGRQAAVPPPPEPPVPPSGADPIQALSTVLGRFQRHLGRGEAGAGQEMWSDDCMEELVTAVEIAMANGWSEVKEALVGAGRVLRSYEKEGCANYSIAFLKDTHSILSMMVGNLIVGAVRGDVIQRWRDRFEAALKEIEGAGLTLVLDEEEREVLGPPARSPEGDEPLGIEEIEPEQDEEVGWADTDEQMAAVVVPEPPVPAPEEGEGPTAEDVAIEALDVSASQEDESWAPSVEDALSIDELLPREEAAGSALEPVEAEEGEVDEAYVPEPPEPTEADADGLEDVAVLLDAMSEDLASLNADSDTPPDAVLDTICDKLADLRTRALEVGQAGAAELCHRMAELATLACEGTRAQHDAFLTVGYGFGEAYVEALESPDSPMVASWRAEVSDLIQTWQQKAAEADREETSPQLEVAEELEAAAPDDAQAIPELVALEASEPPAGQAPAVQVEIEEEAASAWEDVEDQPAAEGGAAEELKEPEVEAAPVALAEESLPAEAPVIHEPTDAPRPVVVAASDDASDVALRALLQTAQDAIAEGNVSSAKMLVLQAAANLAKVEAAKAEMRVKETEIRLQESGRGVEGARAHVREAEQGVVDAENRKGEGVRACETRSQEIAHLEQSRDEQARGIAELDEEIRVLQARRAEEAQRLEAAEAEVKAAHERQAEAQAEQRRLAQAEQAARERLEDARQEVKNHQRKYGEVESALVQARENLEQQRVSLAEIEHTIGQVRGKATPASADDDNLLF